MTSMSSQLASDGIILSTAGASKLMTACNSYARCCRSVEWEADNSSTKDWHCKGRKIFISIDIYFHDRPKQNENDNIIANHWLDECQHYNGVQKIQLKKSIKHSSCNYRALDLKARATDHWHTHAHIFTCTLQTLHIISEHYQAHFSLN